MTYIEINDVEAIKLVDELKELKSVIKKYSQGEIELSYTRHVNILARIKALAPLIQVRLGLTYREVHRL